MKVINGINQKFTLLINLLKLNLEINLNLEEEELIVH
jgi:hypothetical protein